MARKTLRPSVAKGRPPPVEKRPITAWRPERSSGVRDRVPAPPLASKYPVKQTPFARSEEHTSELQSLLRTSYAVFCLKKKIRNRTLSPQTTEATIHPPLGTGQNNTRLATVTYSRHYT